MGRQKKGGRDQSRELAATDIVFTTPSEACRGGRRLKMWFVSRTKPELFRVEYYCGHPTEFSYLQQRANHKDHRFTFTDVPQALSLLFLEFCCAGMEGRERGFSFPGSRFGSLAASLGYAMKGNGKIHTLFTNFPTDGGELPGLDLVLGGINLEGKEDCERQVFVKSDHLAADCVEVYWENERLTKPDELRRLNATIREGWGLEPSRQTPSKDEPKRNPATPRPVAARTQIEAKPVEPPRLAQTEPRIPQEESVSLSKAFADILRSTFNLLRSEAQPERTGSPPPPDEQDATKTKEAPSISERPSPVSPEWFRRPESASLPAIDPKLFQVEATANSWPDSMGLIRLPDGDFEHVWTLKHAFEGVLILGRTGAGKTTGGGDTFAEAFLRRGFGGLVLTVKADEAEHWRRLCRYCGRENDLILVQRGENWKLNLLAYEAQHPGRGSGLSENLTGFCRNLLRISSRSKGDGRTNEEIWERAGDQLLNATFDLFLLAGGNITFDRLADFVAAAPTEKLPATEEDWLQVPVFGSVLLKAKNSVASPEDERLFIRATDYWFKIYRGYSSKIRTSVTLGIFAMFDAFRGRDIPALVSSETNVTPESIMSGKIVVLDLPYKELRHTGLMVQSGWKYLFQVALERQRRSRNAQQRPVFLWEDEAQYFFSEHDHHFQDTARSSRVCRVMLTQNLNSFYKELGQGGREAANVVFGNLNTKVFHNNSDHETNRMAADLFGQEIHTRYTFTSGPEPQARDFFDSIRQSFDPPDTTSVAGAEHWEYVVRPEEFNKLRTGGPENDFLVDAYITWMGLSAEKERHFTRITFMQNQNL